ncbi:MAG: helix-turn-helix domain-containing protein, partial [Thermoplasmata archaeon]
TGFAIQGGTRETAQVNLEIARTIFSKWSLEIMVILYTRRAVRFGELRRLLGGISSRVLSGRLKTLEDRGFIQRSILGSRPPRVVYVLTPEGHTVSRLGEPVFLYLRARETYGSRLSPPAKERIVIPSITPALPLLSAPLLSAPRRRERVAVH